MQDYHNPAAHAAHGPCEPSELAGALGQATSPEDWARIADAWRDRPIELGPLSQLQLEYIARLGISLAFATPLGVGSTSAVETERYVGTRYSSKGGSLHVKRGTGGSALSVPTVTSRGTFWQGRLDVPKLATARHPRPQRFIMSGKSAWGHGLPIYTVKRGRFDELLVITEGMFKAISVQENIPEVQAVGLRGVNTTLTTDGKRELNWSWFDLLGDLRGREACIVFDADVFHKPDVRRALLNLRDALTKAGVYVTFALIRDDDPKAKLGPDDFIVRHGAQAFRALLASRVPAHVGQRLGRTPAPVDRLRLAECPVLLDSLERATPIEQTEVYMALRSAGLSGHTQRGLISRTFSKFSLTAQVQLALSTDMLGWPMRKARAALRTEPYSLAFGNDEVSAIVADLRARGVVAPADDTKRLVRQPSTPDAVLDRELRKQVRWFRTEATVRHMLIVLESKGMRVDRTRLAKRLAAVKTSLGV